MVQIVLLEDDPVDCELIETLLKGKGIEAQFVWVHERQRFIACLTEKTPHVILANYVLPKFNGLAALELAKQICPDVPFVLVSGVMDEEQGIEAMRQGADDYVSKQHLERLVPVVRRSLRNYQERLQRQHLDSLLHTMAEVMPVSIVALSRQQTVIAWNAAAASLYGWSADAVIDQPIPFLPIAQHDAFNRCFAQVLQNQPVINQAHQHQKQDGSLISVNASLLPLPDVNGQIDAIVMIAADVAERHLIESISVMRDEFLAALSHELRTPLNSIVGWSKLMKRGSLRPHVRQTAIEAIERSAIAQTRFVENLLASSNLSRGQVQLTIQPVDMVYLIHTTVETLRPSIRAKSIRLSFDLAHHVGYVLADQQRLQQVVWHLLSNAVKFTPRAGEIIIRLGLADTHRICLQVTDTGVGIAPDFLPYIFGGFRPADSSTTGSQGVLGLGLAIARRLVELHGGQIDVNSPGLGQGATFIVSLPVPQASADGQVSTHSPVDGPDLQGLKALVVEDEPDLCELIALVLEQQGAKTVSAGCVQDAWHLLENFHPDVIISDINLPVVNGYDFLRQVRTLPDPHLQHVPAIAITADTDETAHHRVLAAGYQAYVAKPFELFEVVDAVYQLIHTSK